MRTPEEIKEGLRRHKDADCGHCPYYYENPCMPEWLDDMDAYIKQLEAHGWKWISVKEQLPEKWKGADGTLINYMVYMPGYGVDVGNYLQPTERWVCMGIPCKVTHWMPLPEPPKEA